MREEDLKIGDRIKIGELETYVEDFTTVAGQRMITTPYGDFTFQIVKKIKR
jgi:hypothetical protein